VVESQADERECIRVMAVVEVAAAVVIDTPKFIGHFIENI
jgi:hypothetical protein